MAARPCSAGRSSASRARPGASVLATAVWSGLDVRELELLDLGYAPPFSGVYDSLLIAARQTAKRVQSR
jgi:hypothetical protein